MLKLPVDSIIAKIHGETGISKDEIEKQIKNKIKELDGLVSDEGAAFIVASELGVGLLNASLPGKTVDIKNLMPGMKNIDISGKIVAAFPPRSFVRQGETREVASLVIEDATGKTRVVFWDDKPSLVREGKITRGAEVRIKNSLIKLGKTGEKEVHAGMRSTVIVTSAGTASAEMEEKSIAELSDGDKISITGEVVSLFEPKLYLVCSTCNRKVIPAPEGYICKDHKLVSPNDSMLLGFHIDDGTETIRAVAFGPTAEKLCGLSIAEIKAQGADANETVSNNLLGRTVRLTGRVKDNKNFARLEFLATDVITEINPREIATKLLGQ
jgi:replication factor A1